MFAKLRNAVAATLALLLAATPPLAAAESDLESSVARMAKIGGCWSPSLSPDGNQLAFVSDLNGVPQVWVIDTAGGFPRLVTALDDQVGSVSWSPDGEWLVFTLAPGGGMNQQLYLVRPEGGAPRLVTDGGKVNNWLGGWSHDGLSRPVGITSTLPPSSIPALVLLQEWDRYGDDGSLFLTILK